MIPRNDPFTCDACRAAVPPAGGTFRNHCPQCLTSKHVDEQLPGDRASRCRGLMPPLTIEGTYPDQLDVIQQCEKCSKVMRNKVARDDNREKVFEIMTR